MMQNLLTGKIGFNPVIANVFFRAGLIEAWGRGIFKIIHASRVSNSPDLYSSAISLVFL